MDGVNGPDENGKISSLLDPDAEKQTFGRKSQNLTNLKDENGILLFNKTQHKKLYKQMRNRYYKVAYLGRIIQAINLCKHLVSETTKPT
ncbi:hypothetical protein Hanom_Chr04g00349801 [Helianthus anomalus]